MSASTQVWLLSLGAPATPAGARAWVRALWSDPDATTPPMPGLRALWGWLSARFAAPALAARCEHLDADTLRWAEVERQARDLGRLLGPNYAVRPVLRYAGPTAEQAARDTRTHDRVILLPLDAQVGGPTTISPLRHAHRVLAGHPAARTEILGYPDHPLYVEAVAETLCEVLVDLAGADAAYEVVFCARGMPGPAGPYPAQVQATVAAVVARTRLARPHHLAYTRAPTWLGGPRPQVRRVVQDRGRAGVQTLVLVPVGFTSDHVETRIELDEELPALARAAGVTRLVRAPTVATRPTFLRALATLVHEAEDRAGWDVPWRELPAVVEA